MENFLAPILRFVILVLFAPNLFGAGQPCRPNIVLFLVDDMGWMDSTPYGSRYYETPNMERLSLQSMRFTNAYALPLCSPTRASILSGQYSARHGVTSATGHLPALPEGASRYPANGSPNQRFLYPASKNYLDPKIVTLAEVLRDAGYRTAHIGKWHLGLNQRHWPEQQGFEVAFHAEPSPGPASYFSPYQVFPDGNPSPRHHVGTITDGPQGEYITDRLTDEALRFIETNKASPFFLNFWHFAVHGPWGHKEEYTKQFSGKHDPRGKQDNPIMASMLKSVDESLGRLLDKLDELGLADNTLFLFYSDNGGNTHSNIPGARGMDVPKGHPKWEFVRDWRKWAGDQPPTNNAPLREGKGRIYEGGQRVPLMVRWPGKVKEGSVSDAIVGPIDLYPTILDATGTKAPAGQILDGETILPVLEQTGQPKRAAYFTWFPHLIPAVSVRTGGWKLVRRFEPHPDYPETRELYNLAEDIGESHNLAASQPEKVKELDALIDQFIQDTGALTPIPNPAYKTSRIPVAPTNAYPAPGFVARMCKVVATDGAIRISGDGKQPFLGTAQVKLTGSLELQLRIRCEAGGTARVQWKTDTQENFPATGQMANYEIPEGKSWANLKVPLPIEGKAGIIRLYFPAEKSPVDIRSIQFLDAKGRTKAWDFSGLEP